MTQTVPGIRTRWSNRYITATHWSGYRVRVPRDWSKSEEEEHEAAARECLRLFATERAESPLTGVWNEAERGYLWLVKDY